MYKVLVKPLLFLLSPEKAHHFTVSLLKIVLGIPIVRSIFKKMHTIEDESLHRNIFGLTFKNPVGLAAGFDKDGKYFESMAALGFGFIECGTVTPRPQIGNPQPRLFRLPKDGALINRMGFNNEGVDHLVKKLKVRKKSDVIIGGNIGKNKDTPNENAVDDYEICFEKLFPYVDYFVVNVSSPNTPNLRALQDREPLTKLLTHLQNLNHSKPTPKPILLKIAPDLNNNQLDDILEIVKDSKISGVIATNTTIDRSKLTTSKNEIEKIGNGGLSGAPLKQRSTEVIRYLNEHSKGNLKIIAVGGISSEQDAIEKLKAGASLVQIYTGLIYEGPHLIRNINEAIKKEKFI